VGFAERNNILKSTADFILNAQHILVWKYRFAIRMAGPSEVQYYGFGILSDSDHETQSVVSITSYELFSGSQPVQGGVYDLRMGTTDHHYRCLSCAHEKKMDPGHPGDLRLKIPYQDPLGVAETRRWLRVICLKCGTLMVDPADYSHLGPTKRLAAAALAPTEGKKCKTCGTIHPKIVKNPEDHFTFLAPPAGASGLDQGKYKLYPHVIKSAFERVSNASIVALGRSVDVHPRKLLHSVMQAPSNAIRPGVKSLGVGSSASYHDITSMFQHIVKRNMQLPDRLPDSIDVNLDRTIQNLGQLCYDMILGSASTSVTQGNSGKRGMVVGTKPAPAILRRHPRKRGRIRENLLGKRVFFISRTTISGNTKLRIDQVGVPIAVAKTEQVKDTIQEYNRDQLMTVFLNGKKGYPGCTRIIKHSTGDVHDVENLRRDFQLDVGDDMYRDIVDGDLAFFNRQPTLEKSSIGVHKVVVLQDPSAHTFQMNVSACENYNADWTASVKVPTGSRRLRCRTSQLGKRCKCRPANAGYNYLVARNRAARLSNCGKPFRACATKRVQ
jgi:DNA-directed RNA polymerase beta' subunit